MPYIKQANTSHNACHLSQALNERLYPFLLSLSKHSLAGIMHHLLRPYSSITHMVLFCNIFFSVICFLQHSHNCLFLSFLFFCSLSFYLNLLSTSCPSFLLPYIGTSLSMFQLFISSFCSPKVPSLLKSKSVFRIIGSVYAVSPWMWFACR